MAAPTEEQVPSLDKLSVDNEQPLAMEAASDEALPELHEQSLNNEQSFLMAAASKDELPTLDKILLNNEILRLRPTAVNAKINVIRKLSREIKSLNAKRDGLPEAIQLKKKAKAEKLTNELQLAKTFDKDVITISALIYSPSESSKILQNPTSSLKDKVLIKIACNKVLVSGVGKMLAKYKPIKYKKLEKVVSSIGVKKKKKKPVLSTAVKRSLPELPVNESSESSESSEESDGSEDSDSSTSKKRSKKAKHSENLPVETSDEIDAETQDVESNEMSVQKRKKAKRSENLQVETSYEIDADTQDFESNEISVKKRKKAKHSENLPVETSDEIDAETQVAERDEIPVKRRKKAKRSENLQVEMFDEIDAETQVAERDEMPVKRRKKAKRSENLQEEMSDEIDAETQDVEREEMSAKRKKKAKRSGNCLKETSDEIDAGTQDVEREEMSPKKRKKAMHDKIRDIGAPSNGEDKMNKKSDKDQAEPSKPKKAAVLSTKAIRFSDLLKMESTSCQPNIFTKPQVPEGKKMVDGFFVSRDGRSNFLTWVPEKFANNQEKRNADYEEIREQYLKEFGAVPSRTELRRIEREGMRGLKSFHKLVVKESVDDTRMSAPKPGTKRPPRMIIREPTWDDIPVHPSWEAKQQAKNLLIVPFQGKTIKFDD